MNLVNAKFVKNIGFVKKANALTGFIYKSAGSGVLTITGIGTLFLTEVQEGDNIFALDGSNIGGVSEVVSNTELSLGVGSASGYLGVKAVVGATLPTLYVFECGYMDFIMKSDTRRFTLINKRRRDFNVGWRAEFKARSTYLRRIGNGTYDIIDMINTMDSEAVSVFFPSLSDMPFIEVVRDNDDLLVNVGTEKPYVVMPRLNLELSSVDEFTTLPSWFKHTKPTSLNL